MPINQQSACYVTRAIRHTSKGIRKNFCVIIKSGWRVCLGELRIAPYDVYFDKHNVFQPDIVFVSKENVHIIKKNGLHGAPDLVIEIFSSGTQDYDRSEKRLIYEKYRVKEYWLVEPESKEVTIIN